VDGSTDFCHRWWQTKAAERLGIARLNNVAFKSPDLFTYKKIHAVSLLVVFFLRILQRF